MKQRNESLDVIRALAAFCVVVNHATEFVYSMNLEKFDGMTWSSRSFFFLAFTFGRIGVPLFLLLSGYLLLPRYYDAAGVKKFYKHNFLPMLGVWEIWVLIYCIFISWHYQEPFDMVQYIQKALLLRHAGLSHVWYMPMIIGMYLFLPYVANALHQMKGKLLAIFMLVVYAYCFVAPSVNLYQSVFQIFPEQLVSAQPDLSYGGNCYGLYVVLGYAIARYQDKIEEFLPRNNCKKFLILAGGGGDTVPLDSLFADFVLYKPRMVRSLV